MVVSDAAVVSRADVIDGDSVALMEGADVSGLELVEASSLCPSLQPHISMMKKTAIIKNIPRAFTISPF